MAKNNLLSFVENLEQNMERKDSFKIIEDYWNEKDDKYNWITKKEK